MAIRPVILTLFLLSGGLGLVYEVVWVRMLGLVFGVAAFAVATVLACFMGGLAVGAAIFGRVAPRLRNPIAFYGLLEIAIAFWALLTPRMTAYLGSITNEWVRAGALDPELVPFALLRFALASVILVPPTILMGGTLPLLVHWWRAESPDAREGRVAVLYGLNTFGAVAGTYLAGFHLLPWLGVANTVRLAAAGGIVLGVALLFVSRTRMAETTPAREPASGAADASGAGARAIVLPLFLVLGAVALSYEVYWTRILSLVLGPSVYAFSLMLTAYLAGVAGGSLLMRWALPRIRMDRILLASLLQGTAAALVLLTLGLFSRYPYWFLKLRMAIGSDTSLVSGASVPLVLLTLLPPTLALGASFPALAAAGPTGARRFTRWTGDLYTANTIGGILGSFLTGFVLLPRFGVETGMGILIAVHAFGALLLARIGGSARPHRGLRNAATVALLLLATIPLVLVTTGVPLWDRKAMTVGPYQKNLLPVASDRARFERYVNDAELLFYDEGLTATITVRKLGGQLLLQTNGKTDASSGGDMRTQILIGQLPALLHPGGAKRGLVIGLASGVTAANVLTAGIESLDIVELEAGVLEASRFFDTWNGSLLERPEVAVHVADGRNYLEQTNELYDIIASEPSNPWISGVNYLFTREAFEAMRARLAPAGIVSQWFHIYGMSRDDLLTLLHTFASVFPAVDVFVLSGGDMILLGSDRPMKFDIAAIEARMNRPVNREAFRIADLPGVHDLLTAYQFSIGDSLREAWSSVPLNTDDNMRLEFSAPRHLYDDRSEANRDFLATFRDRARLHRSTAGSHLALARGAVRMWDLGLAADELARERASETPDLAGAANLEARIWMQRAGQERNASYLDSAATRIRAALSHDPESAEAHFLTGSLELNRGNPAGAIEELTEAERLGHDPALVRSFLGAAWERAGNPERAIAAYRSALAADPANPIARQALQRLRAP